MLKVETFPRSFPDISAEIIKIILKTIGGDYQGRGEGKTVRLLSSEYSPLAKISRKKSNFEK